ncbi:division/cell wall cluster transcriptional repressor MraZ [Rhodobacteraceae bacterium]|nr:division/cell wall cluster transcriptional repressor MraZ [Paracoccaceae bacterium]
MVRSFRGEGTQKVDAKGRVSIPATFRAVLRDGDPSWTDGKPPEFVIVYGGEDRNFLECFTMDAVKDVDEKITRMSRGSKARRKLSKMFNGQSQTATVDDTGRIVLPAKLRNKIDIDGDAYFIAMGDTFEIWKPETYEASDEMPQGADIWMLLEEGEGQ